MKLYVAMFSVFASSVSLMASAQQASLNGQLFFVGQGNLLKKTEATLGFDHTTRAVSITKDGHTFSGRILATHSHLGAKMVSIGFTTAMPSGKQHAVVLKGHYLRGSNGVVYYGSGYSKDCGGHGGGHGPHSTPASEDCFAEMQTFVNAQAHECDGSSSCTGEGGHGGSHGAGWMFHGGFHFEQIASR